MNNLVVLLLQILTSVSNIYILNYASGRVVFRDSKLPITAYFSASRSAFCSLVNWTASSGYRLSLASVCNFFRSAWAVGKNNNASRTQHFGLLISPEQFSEGLFLQLSGNRSYGYWLAACYHGALNIKPLSMLALPI